MSKKNSYITFLFLSFSLIGYGQLTLNGAGLTLSGNSLLYSSDDIILNNTVADTSKIEVKGNSRITTKAVIKNSGVIVNQGFVDAHNYLSTSDSTVVTNKGEITITGNFNATKGAYAGSGFSSVSFTGGGNHLVHATDRNQFRLLVVEDGNIVMESDFIVNNIQFNSDKIVCNGHRLGVLGNIAGFNTNSYVQGQLARVVKSGDYVMPVGTSNKYRPAKITGVTDSTVVFMEVYSSTKDLQQFGDLKEVDEAVVWKYYTDPATVGNLTSPYKIGVAYDMSDLSRIGTNGSSHRVSISDTLEAGYYNYGGTSGGVIQSGLTTLYSTDGIPTSGLISVGEICSLNEFVVSALLEGPYNKTTGLMNNNITTELKSEFEFGGNASTKMRAGFAVPTGAVDVISVVLRDKTTLNRIDTAYAWLMRNGGTKDFETGLKAKLGYCDVSSSEFYIQVEHRNHLPIMSSSSYIRTPSVTTVDLKDPSKVYSIGYNSSFNVTTMNNDVLMFAGDNKKSASNVVNAIDYFKVIDDLSSLPTGYLNTDLNLSGAVESGDNDLGLDNSSQLRKSTVR